MAFLSRSLSVRLIPPYTMYKVELMDVEDRYLHCLTSSGILQTDIFLEFQSQV